MGDVGRELADAGYGKIRDPKEMLEEGQELPPRRSGEELTTEEYREYAATTPAYLILENARKARKISGSLARAWAVKHMNEPASFSLSQEEEVAWKGTSSYTAAMISLFAGG